MPCPITITKFVGTISLGLLTGVSYTTSTVTIPALQLLPSAAGASRTLSDIQSKSLRAIVNLSLASSVSFITAYLLASPRGKHPYLIWTALSAIIAGEGVEFYFYGSTRARYLLEGNRSRGASIEDEQKSVNGESVEREMAKEKRAESVRAVVAGLGFLAAVVGIWGDGA